MSAQTLVHPALPDGCALTAGQKGALDQFENALVFCVGKWYDDKTSLVLSDNIHERFGAAAAEFFQHSLVTYVGMPVTLTLVNTRDGQKTHVQMPKRIVPPPVNELQLTTNPLTATSVQNAVAPRTSSAVTKKAPRPMNCWIIFREQMHKQLKREFPDVSVQVICKHPYSPHLRSHLANYTVAKQCSKIWRNLTPDEKMPYQLAAQSAKEEHMRLHPDYRYSPRKPGEKKKRQSRKAKQAAEEAAVQEQAFDFSSPPEMTAATVDASNGFAAASGANNTIDDIVFDVDFASLTNQATFFGLEQDGLAVHDSESLRHDRLQAEVGPELDANLSFNFLGEEHYAFRAGADGNATFTSVYHDGY
jgi:hypothetical protein